MFLAVPEGAVLPPSLMVFFNTILFDWLELFDFYLNCISHLCQKVLHRRRPEKMICFLCCSKSYVVSMLASSNCCNLRCVSVGILKMLQLTLCQCWHPPGSPKSQRKRICQSPPAPSGARSRCYLCVVFC